MSYFKVVKGYSYKMEPKEEAKRSRLARLVGREGELASTAMLSFGGAGKNRGIFKRLYKFDKAKELDEWELPFAKGRSRLSGAVITNTVLPPLNQTAFLEEGDSEENSFIDSDASLLQSMFSSTKKKRGQSVGSRAQETLFVDRESYVFKELKKI